jgi:hypothetical protein
MFTAALLCPVPIRPARRNFLLTFRIRYARVTDGLRVSRPRGWYRGGKKGISLLVSQLLAIRVSPSHVDPLKFAGPEPRSPKIVISRTRPARRPPAGRHGGGNQQLTNVFVSQFQLKSSKLKLLRTVVAELAEGTTSRVGDSHRRARTFNNIRTLCANKNTLNSNPLNQFCTLAHQKAPEAYRALTILDFRRRFPGRAAPVRQMCFYPLTITPHVLTIR